jgi:hypothetical protein
MRLMQRPEVRRLVWQCAGALVLAIFGYVGLQWLPGRGTPTPSARQLTDATGIAPVTVPGQPAVAQTPRLPELNRQAAEMQSQLTEAQRELARLHGQVDAGKAAIISSRAEATQLVATGQHTQEGIDKLISERTRWLTQYKTLWSDDRGRRIAASEEHVGLALSVLSKQRIDDTMITGWRSALAELVAPLEASLKNPESGVSLTPKINQQFLTIRQDASTEHQVLRDDMLILDRLIEETKDRQPARQTLTEVDNERKLATAKQKDAAERDRMARDEAAALASKEKLDEERRVEAARIASEKEAARLAAEKLRREFDRDYAKIKGRLVAFTSDGMELRGGSVGKGPVSFSLMQGRGALDRTDRGRQQIAIVVGESRRDSGGLMKFQGGQSEQQATDFDMIQEFLLKYGQHMVKEGLLAP